MKRVLLILTLLTLSISFCTRIPTDSGKDKKPQPVVIWKINTNKISNVPLPNDVPPVMSSRYNTARLTNAFYRHELLYVNDIPLKNFVVAERTVTLNDTIVEQLDYFLWNVNSDMTDASNYKNKGRLFGWRHVPEFSYSRATHTDPQLSGPGYEDYYYNLESVVKVKIGPELTIMSRIRTDVSDPNAYWMDMYCHSQLWWLLLKVRLVY